MIPTSAFCNQDQHVGDGAEGQGLLGGRSFPFQGLVGAERSKPSVPMERSINTAGEQGKRWRALAKTKGSLSCQGLGF